MFDGPVARRRVGAVAWGIGLVTALGWTWVGAGGADGVGYGFAPPVEVAAAETARLLDLPVTLHQRVRAQDVVARLDASMLEAERERALARVPEAADERTRGALTEARQFAQGLDDRLADRASIAASIAEDEAELVTLRERLTEEQQLAAAGASSRRAVAEWEARIRVVEARLKANRAALALASSAASAARRRMETLPAEGYWAVHQVDVELRLLDLRIDEHELRAWVDGEVSWVYRRPGEVIRAGEPVVQIRPVSTREVVAYLPPARAQGLEPGARAAVRRATGQVVRGELVSVGAGPQEVPTALWTTPSWPEYGVPIRVLVDTEIGPNEAVTVHL